VIFQRTVLSGLVAELPPEVWTSDEVERRLAPLYGRLKLPEGRLELMTGIRERRFWPQAIRPSAASALAGRRAMQAAGVGPADIDLLIHSSVCRDRLEPSTAAYVHGLLGLGPQAQILDVSNACLGFLNAVALAAGMVESGQIRRALVCSGEDGRPLVERTIRMLNEDLALTRETIKPYFANLTIGAGGAAAVVSRDDLAAPGAIRLLGGAAETDSSANGLCEGDTSFAELDMRTDSEALLAAAAAHLLDGGSPSLLGPSRSEWVERSVLKPEVRSPQAALVHVQYVDHYGQLVTDADQAWLQRWHMGQSFETNVRGQRVRQWWGESGLPSGSLYFRYNRHQLLEIGMVDGGSDSVNQAARLLGMKPGDALELKLR
jgi:3-oxoacyl-[acyl-carrier-protein] synthase III